MNNWKNGKSSVTKMSTKNVMEVSFSLFTAEYFSTNWLHTFRQTLWKCSVLLSVQCFTVWAWHSSLYPKRLLEPHRLQDFWLVRGISLLIRINLLSKRLTVLTVVESSTTPHFFSRTVVAVPASVRLVILRLSSSRKSYGVCVHICVFLQPLWWIDPLKKRQKSAYFAHLC